MKNLIMALGLFAAVQAHAAEVDHIFYFDTAKDGQKAAVMDYEYGDATRVGANAPRWAVEEGREFRFDNRHSIMPVGEYLFVKWLDRDTGNGYEVRANLRGRMPEDMLDHTVTFIIRGAELSVYVISPAGVAKSPESVSDGPRMFRDRNVIRVF